MTRWKEWDTDAFRAGTQRQATARLLENQRLVKSIRAQNFNDEQIYAHASGIFESQLEAAVAVESDRSGVGGRTIQAGRLDKSNSNSN